MDDVESLESGMSLIRSVTYHTFYLIGIIVFFIVIWSIASFFMHSAFGAAVAGLIAIGVTGLFMSYTYSLIFENKESEKGE